MRGTILGLIGCSILLALFWMTHQMMMSHSPVASDGEGDPRDATAGVEEPHGVDDRAKVLPTRAPGMAASQLTGSQETPPERIPMQGEPLGVFAYDEDTVPERAQVQRAVEAALAEHFDRYRLSSDELDRVTDSLVDLREAQVELRMLPFGPETADRRRLLVERIGEATSSFNEVLDMDPADLTAEASTGLGGGIDRFDPNEPVPEAEYIEATR